jgi:hypothetical protein
MPNNIDLELDELLRRANDEIASNQAVLDMVGDFNPRSQNTLDAEEFLGVNVHE